MGQIEPTRDANGKVIKLRPQERYARRDSEPLNRYGHGYFGEFRVAGLPAEPGVYVLEYDDIVPYVGECIDLRKRFYGYGHISPKNCYIGGRSTNCKVNSRLTLLASAGYQVNLWFYCCDAERKAVERELVTNLRPVWNGRIDPLIGSAMYVKGVDPTEPACDPEDWSLDEGEGIWD